MRSIERDPFARHNIVRRAVYLIYSNQACMWCGQRKYTSSGRPYLYEYGIDLDSGRTYWQDKLFCSVDCMRVYQL